MYDVWWALTGSNRRHSACKADALPTELSALRKKQLCCFYDARQTDVVLVFKYFKSQEFKINGAADGTRTRDPRRDRPIF